MRNLWCSKVKLTIPWSSGIYPCIIFTGLWSLVDLVELPPITLILRFAGGAGIWKSCYFQTGTCGWRCKRTRYGKLDLLITVYLLYSYATLLCNLGAVCVCTLHWLPPSFSDVDVSIGGWFSFVLGLFFLWPCIDEMQKVDLRVLSYDVPPQEVSILIYC